MTTEQTLPKELESEVVARFQDCDPFGHLNNARYMDYFINIPADTQGRGLKDAFVRLHLTPLEKRGLAIDVHQFSLEEDFAGEDGLGMEIDLTFISQVNRVTSIMIGASKFLADEGMELLGRITPGEDPTFAFAMVNVIF